MMSHPSSPAKPGGLAAALEQGSEPARAAELPPSERTRPAAVAPEVSTRSLLDGSIVEELTSRLPTSELVKIIKGALECGRRNRPFTESDLLRAMTFGSSAVAAWEPPAGRRSPRG